MVVPVITAWLTRYAALVLGAALVLALVLTGVQTVRLDRAHSQFAKYESQVAKRDAQSELQRANDERAARAAEQGLRDQADKTRKTNAQTIRTLNARHAAIVVELRNRPERPAVASSSPVAAVACAGSCGTGATLFRDDAEFLVGLAVAAAKIGAERDTCRDTYNAAREALRPKP